MKFAIRFTLAALLVSGLSLISPGSADAQCGGFQHGFAGGGCGWGGCGWGGYGFGLSPYTSGRVPVPPYFALHPPVYYSVPVARPYGWSPFAFPATHRGPELAMTQVEPITIQNPYVESPEETEETVNEAAANNAATDDFAERPLVIENPFVPRQPVTVEAEQLASVEYLELE